MERDLCKGYFRYPQDRARAVQLRAGRLNVSAEETQSVAMPPLLGHDFEYVPVSPKVCFLLHEENHWVLEFSHLHPHV